MFAPMYLELPNSTAVTPAIARQAEEMLSVGTLGAGGNSIYISSHMSVRGRFKRLTDAWKMEKMLTSSMSAIESSAYYQAIIALAYPVVPLIFRELQREPDHWFAALHEILGEDPVPPEDRGNLDRMTKHWLAWGNKHGFVV